MTETPSYEVVEGWGAAPFISEHLDAPAVTVAEDGRVYVLTRQPARVLVYDEDGVLLGALGDGLFSDRTHGITAHDGALWCVDDGNHAIHKLDPDGNLLLTLGTPGVPSDTGYVFDDQLSITRGGPPFNRPTNLSVGPDGLLYVTDGYGNARVHVFTPDGTLLRSWGEPGEGPGEFRRPHGIQVMPDGRVLVADRESDRIQVFDTEGGYVEEWLDIQRPTNIAYDARNDRLLVSELRWKPGESSFRLGDRDYLHSRLSVLDPQGTVLARIGWEDDPAAPGNLVAAHDVAVDGDGNVYVAEVTWTIGVRDGRVANDCHKLQKFLLRA